METNADRVELAGTEKFRTCNIMSTKHKVKQPEVIEIHEEWAEKNGYRTAASHKRQATSVKRYKEQQATSVECDPNHRAPSSVQRQAASRESRTKDTVLRSAERARIRG